jgi:hypothetical protein
MKILDMKTRKEILRAWARRYKGLKKKEKASVLDEAVTLLGYQRSYVATVLRHLAEVVAAGDGRVVRPFRRRSRRVYDARVREALKRIWEWMDYPCGKRLAPLLPRLIPKLVHCGELKVPPVVQQKLQRLSPATIDRLLADQKARLSLRSQARTKPGTLLKSQIPIRTVADWSDQRPGFVEIDLVGHDGGQASGEFAQTLDVTDVASGWTETQAVPTKAQRWVLQALQAIRRRLPFPLLGIDSDNGSEFINQELLRYCEGEQITFTRARPYRKNDTCFVEQKNWSIVRRTVGYARYDTPEAVTLLNTLYRSLRLYSNCFQPSMKLVDKVRQGARVTKHYDRAQTPLERLVTSPHISSGAKRRLRRLYDRLNPVALKRTIEGLQHQLDILAGSPSRKVDDDAI